jgi:hypothetical protein
MRDSGFDDDVIALKAQAAHEGATTALKRLPPWTWMTNEVGASVLGRFSRPTLVQTCERQGIGFDYNHHPAQSLCCGSVDASLIVKKTANLHDVIHSRVPAPAAALLSTPSYCPLWSCHHRALLLTQRSNSSPPAVILAC